MAKYIGPQNTTFVFSFIMAHSETGGLRYIW